MEANTLIAPPLDLDLASVDTSRQLLKDNEYYHFRVEKAEVKKTKAGADMLSLEYSTTMPSQSIKGDPLGAGIRCFDNINLQPSGKSTWQIVLQGVASFYQSLENKEGLSGKFADFALQAPMLLGRTFKAKVGYVPEGVSRDGKSYQAKNQITLYVKA